MDNVLVTGGTGAFGRAFTTYLLRHTPCQRIVIYSRNEHNQHLMRQQLSRYHPRLRFMLGDVRDKDRLTMAMRDVTHVVHAAALKRIENGVYNPLEVSRTNVEGTASVVEAAMANGVRKAILLSSDKAFAPVSTYGATKLTAEFIFLNANNMRGWGGPLFSVTRYGNVWNSTGSVVPVWREAIKAGRDIEVRDPECTRFYMTLREAVELVMNTFSVMKGGEVVIPTLPAYRVGDLVEAMGIKAYHLSKLPPEEKLHESMKEGLSSDTARRMTVDELRVILHDT